MEPQDVRNLLWLGWIFDGDVEEVHRSELTVEDTIERSGVMALEHFLDKVDEFKFTRKWSNEHNLEAISATVTDERQEVDYKVTVLGYWSNPLS